MEEQSWVSPSHNTGAISPPKNVGPPEKYPTNKNIVGGELHFNNDLSRSSGSLNPAFVTVCVLCHNILPLIQHFQRSLVAQGVQNKSPTVTDKTKDVEEACV